MRKQLEGSDGRIAAYEKELAELKATTTKKKKEKTAKRKREDDDDDGTETIVVAAKPPRRKKQKKLPHATDADEIVALFTQLDVYGGGEGAIVSQHTFGLVWNDAVWNGIKQHFGDDSVEMKAMNSWVRQVRSNKDGRKFVCGECDTLEACEGKTNLQCQGVDQSTGVQCPEVCCTDCNGVLKTWTLTKKGDAYCLCCESQAAAAAAAVHDA